MYNPTVICTYMDDDVFLETDDINDAEKDFIRNCIYRQELLNAFSLDEYDDEQINKTIAELFPLVQSVGLPLCATEMEDPLVGFMMLFSFDFFYYAHPLICEMLQTGQVQSVETLVSRLSSYSPVA
jgi:hypothetical protein